TAAIAGGTYALAPATAGAMTNEGNECANMTGLDLFFCELEHMGGGGGSGGTGSSGSGSTDTSSDSGNVDSDTQTDQKTDDSQSDDPGSATDADDDADSHWKAVQKRWMHEACTGIRSRIKHRIYRLYGDTDFDSVVNSNDSILDELQAG